MIRYVEPDPLASRPISNPDTSVGRESTQVPLTPTPQENIQNVPGEMWGAIQEAKQRAKAGTSQGENLFATSANPFYHENWPKYGEAVKTGVQSALDVLQKGLQGINNQPKGQR